jgi:3-oxoacyl-[acyl-carrier protein] reductase
MVAEIDLKGKVAFVTGGAVGLGAAIVVALAKAGAKVGFTYLHHDKATVEEQLRSEGGDWKAWQLDATDPKAVQTVVDDAAKTFDGLDILVNNAGGMLSRASLPEIDDHHWHQTLELNLSSALYCTRAAYPHMRKAGRVSFVASLAAQNGGSQGQLSYATAKAGLFGLTRALAKELAPSGTTVNAIAPGVILGTPFHDVFTPKPAQVEAIKRIPLGRAGVPEDVAGAVLFLSSSYANFVTGEILDINGGQWFA